MTAAISWRPQSGTTRIPAWLHTLPDSLSRLRPSIGHSPAPVSAPSSNPSQGHGPTPLTVLVQSGRRGWMYLLDWKLWSLQGSTGGGGSPSSPASHLPPAHPAASPSPTRTKFPTCLSVSDSSRKYLAERAPAVLSPLCLLPAFPGGLCWRSQRWEGARAKKLDGQWGEQRQEGPVSILKHHSSPQAWGIEGSGRPL